MKKILLIFVCFICLLSICGCRNNKQKVLNESDIKKEFSEKYPKNNNNLICEELDNAIVFNHNFTYFATKDKVYKLNPKQLYSNDTNCKEIEVEDLDSDIVTFSQMNQFETKERRYSYFRVVKKFSYYWYSDEIKFQSNMGESLYKKLYESLGNVDFYSYSGDLKEVDGIVLTNDKLKVFKIIYENTVDANIKDFKFMDIKNDIDNEEKIMYIQSNIVKTNKAYYAVKAYKTNKEKCEKYADVKCNYEYKLVKDKFLTKNYDYIKFVSSTSIIDINNNYYTNR